MTNIVQLADQMSKAFVTGTRDNGETYDFVPNDHKEECIQDVIYAAHLDTMPNDWHYKAIRLAVDYISECVTDPGDDMSDHAHSFADGVSPVYTHELLKWLSDCPNAIDYCDGYVDLYGDPGTDILDRIRCGCFEMHYQVFQAVWQALESVAEEVECDV